MSEITENVTSIQEPVPNQDLPLQEKPEHKETPSFSIKQSEEALQELSNEVPNFTLENSQIQKVVLTSQPDQEEVFIATNIVTQMFQDSDVKTPTKISQRSSTVTPGSRSKRDASPNCHHNGNSVVLSRLYTVKSTRAFTPEKSTSRSVSPLSSYINKRVQDRSFELRLSTLEENKKAQLQSQAKGKMILNSITQRREIEKQVDALENRIKRLRTEELLAQKKVEQANEKARKFLATKMRYQEELEAKNLLNKQKEEMIKKRRQELAKEREEAKEKAKKAIIERWRAKFENAYAAKKVSEDNEALAKAKKLAEDEKKKSSAKKVNGWEKLSKNFKDKKHENSIKKINDKYIDKAKEEKEKAQELAQKYKNLEELEKELIAKISVTKRLYMDKVVELGNLR